MRARILIPLALVCLGLPALAAAQEDDDPHHDRHGRHPHSPGLREVDEQSTRSRRKGFWLSAGLGVGGESFDAKDGLGWSDTQTGGFGAVRLGGTVSPSFLVGAELNGWALQDYNHQGYDRQLASLMGIVQWYPSPTGGFWLRGGVGFAHSEVTQFLSSNSSISTSDNGTALALGVGYDIPVSRKVSLTPTLDLMGQRYRDFDERVVSLGLAVAFH
jgi:hypothetical protein